MPLSQAPGTGHPIRRRRLSGQPRSSPAIGSGASRWPTFIRIPARPITPTAARRRGRDVPQSEPRRQPAGHRRGRPRRLLPRADRRADRRLQPDARRLLQPRRTSRITPRPGSSRSRPTIAATTFGSCRPTARGSPRLQILNILEGYDLRSMGRHSPDYLHLFIEAKKLAYADRAKYFADPDVRQAARGRADLEGIRRPAAEADRSAARGQLGRSGRSAAGQGGRHDLSVRRRQGPQLLLVHPEQLRRLRLAARAGQGRLRDAEPRLAVLARPAAPQHARAAQAALPHDHPGDGHEGRQALVRASA